MSQKLPSRPNLDHLKKQAKDTLRVFRRRSPDWKLADAQRAIARGYGFSSWPDLKQQVEARKHHAQRLAPPSEDALTAPADRVTKGSTHPIDGTWISSPANSNRSDFQPSSGGVVLEFEVTADRINITQISTDALGREVAVKMTICADGHEHPVPFGDGLVLRAHWASAQVLETTIKSRGRTIGTGTYEVSPDRRSLVVSTGEQVLVFERI